MIKYLNLLVSLYRASTIHYLFTSDHFNKCKQRLHRLSLPSGRWIVFINVNNFVLEFHYLIYRGMISVQFSAFQSLSHVRLFVTPWTAAHQASLSTTNCRSLLKLMSIESVMPSNHLILCRPLLLLQSFPASGSFQLSQLFTSGGQSIGVSASASVFPMNIQDWFSLGWTSWIPLQSKGLSRVFSNTTVQKHQFFGTQLSLWSNSHIHTWLLEKP